MLNVLGPNTVLGYCTNVHAGPTCDQMLKNLEEYALRVKASLTPDAPMGVGLWLPSQAVDDMLSDDRVEQVGNWLNEVGLYPFTINGFPHGDFHQPVVKHRVYHPTWADTDRLDYTTKLANILATWLPRDSTGSISTLPLGWQTDIDQPGMLDQCVTNLLTLVDHLERIESETGRLIHVDIEPEPGCYLDTCQDMITFFVDRLFPKSNPDRVSRYLRICHDICHTVVMFEDQRETLVRYRENGVKVGKVQVSSAPVVRFDKMSDSDREQAYTQLKEFGEDRYLHQTAVKSSSGDVKLYDDLPDAIADQGDCPPTDPWRVHFHVPLFLDRFGLIETSMSHVIELIQATRTESDVLHFEAETYAWTVLPDELKPDNLADGIARELTWVRDRMSEGAKP